MVARTNSWLNRFRDLLIRIAKKAKNYLAFVHLARLSYRDVEELMAARVVIVPIEPIRDWSQQFGGSVSKRFRSRSARPGDHWHLDEACLPINGKLQTLWRAIDQDGEVLDILMQSRHDK
jgi:putative transposase